MWIERRLDFLASALGQLQGCLFCFSMSEVSTVSANPSVQELKFLLKLLGQEGYQAPLSSLKPSPKVSQRELMAIAQSLKSRGWIDYLSQIERFAITQRGRMLFRVEMAARPVTPDEWRLLQSCRQGPMNLDQIPGNVPPEASQNLLQNLEQQALIKVLRQGAAVVRLTPTGKDFLRRYRPRGSQALLSLDMLTHYLNFLAG